MNINQKTIKTITDQALWSKNYQIGIDKLEKIEKKSANSHYLLSSLGDLYGHLAETCKDTKCRKNLEEIARKKYLQSFKKQPNVGALYGLGRIDVRQQNPRGLSWYKKAVHLSPKDRNTQFAYATALISLNHLERAEKILRSIWKSKKNFDIAYNLTVVSYKRDRTRSAKIFAKKTLGFWSKKNPKVKKSKVGKAYTKFLNEVLDS